MKNLLFVILAVGLFACKKGQEDPAFSLRSRKTRLSGEWKVKSKESVSSTTQITTITNYNSLPVGPNTTEYTINESWKNGTYSFSQIVPNSIPDTTYGGSVTTFNYIINKDGSWSSDLSYSYTVNIDLQGSTISVSFNIGSEGVWNFLGKDQPDTKNKELVAFSTINLSQVKTTVYHYYNSSADRTDLQTDSWSFQPNERTEIWRILELRNKEIKGEILNKPTLKSTSKTETAPGSGNYDIIETTKQTDQKISITLQQE